MLLCGRPMLVFWVLAQILLRRRVISLEMSIPIIITESLPFFSVPFRAFRLSEPHVFLWTLCGLSVSAKQLASHPLSACRSGHFPAIYPHCVHVCDSLLLTSPGVCIIFLVSSTRPQLHCLVRRSMIEIRMVFSAFDSVQFAHHVYFSLPCVVSILPLFLAFLNVSSATRV